MDRDITVSEPINDEQRGDLTAWPPEARVGAIPDGPLNPVLYETVTDEFSSRTGSQLQ